MQGIGFEDPESEAKCFPVSVALNLTLGFRRVRACETQVIIILSPDRIDLELLISCQRFHLRIFLSPGVRRERIFGGIG